MFLHHCSSTRPSNKTASIYGSDTLHPSTATLFRLLLVEGCRVPSLVKLSLHWNRSLVPDSGICVSSTVRGLFCVSISFSSLPPSSPSCSDAKPWSLDPLPRSSASGVQASPRGSPDSYWLVVDESYPWKIDTLSFPHLCGRNAPGLVLSFLSSGNGIEARADPEGFHSKRSCVSVDSCTRLEYPPRLAWSFSRGKGQVYRKAHLIPGPRESCPGVACLLGHPFWYGGDFWALEGAVGECGRCVL